MKDGSTIKGSSIVKDCSSRKAVMFFLKSRPKAGKLAYLFFIEENSMVGDSWAKKGSLVIKDSSIIEDSSSKKTVMFF